MPSSLTDESIRGLDRLLSSPHLMRVANHLWRAMSELRHARAAAGTPPDVVLARLDRLETRLEVLQTKIASLESLLEQDGHPGEATP